MKNSNANKASEPKIIKLTKIKQWYLPVDAESYEILKQCGVPLIRIHENFLPTLGLVTKQKNIKAKSVNFTESIMNPYFDKIGELWNSKPHRKCLITSSVLKFETTNPKILKRSKEHLEKIAASLRRFFTRWGYSCAIEISESRGRCKLHCAYKYSGDNLPVLPLVEDSTSMPTVKLKLGFTRISLVFMQREVEINIAKSAGGTWKSIDTSRCTYAQIGNVLPMLTALGDVISHDQHNADNSND